MRKPRKAAGQDAPGKVCGFRLDETCAERLRAMADRFATTPSQYARAVLTTHLSGDGKVPAGTPTEQALDELGTFLRQVRDEIVAEAEWQRQRLESLTARVSALDDRVKALGEHVVDVDQRLANFLANVDPV